MYRYRVLSIVTVGILTLALPSLVLAAAENETADNETANPAMQEMNESPAMPMAQTFTPKLQKVNSLVGLAMENSKGERLGKIDDIVLNSNRDRVAYAIVGFGGALGINEKYVAVPWHCLELKNEGKTCVLNIEKERFSQAPTFTKSKWPDMNSPQWAHEVHQFFSSNAERTGKMTMEPRPSDYGTKEGERMHEGTGATEPAHLWGVRHVHLIGTDVRNRQGEDLGEIEDVVIDTHKGDVAYGILSFGGVLGMGEKYVAVPWSRLELRPAQRTARLDTDRKTLESIAFKPGEWPNLADPAYARNTYTRFDRDPYWEVFGYVSGQPSEHPETAWLAGSEYTQGFNTKSMETVEGSVESVGTFRPERGAAEGIRLRVKTDAGNVITVHAGPESYLDRNGFTFHNGDRIKLTGSKTTIHDRSLLMAGEIQRGTQKIELYDKQGKPKWTADDLKMR